MCRCRPIFHPLELNNRRAGLLRDRTNLMKLRMRKRMRFRPMPSRFLRRLEWRAGMGRPYHNRKGSNGEIYNMHAMTAAHRTLPLGTIVKVTNIKTGRSAVVRITDRGPFIEGRVLDLSLAAAKAVDVWQPGVAQVRLDVLKTPSAIESGGRWAVQIGAFDHENAANQIADRLTRRYRTAKVLRFASPVGDWWVRVRVQNDERSRAEAIVKETETPEGTVFLVRLD